MTDGDEWVEALLFLGALHAEAGREADALPVFQKTRALAERRSKEQPRDLARQYRLAQALAWPARFASADPARRASALEDQTQAVARLRDLQTQVPSITFFRRELAEVLLRRSETLDLLDRKADALADLNEARGLLGALLKDNDRNTEYHSLMGRVLGRLAGHEPDAARASALLSEAIGHQQRVLAANPKSPIDLKALQEHQSGKGPAR